MLVAIGLPALVGCGATHRVEDEPREEVAAASSTRSEEGEGPNGTNGEALLDDPLEPEPSEPGEGGAGVSDPADSAGTGNGGASVERGDAGSSTDAEGEPIDRPSPDIEAVPEPMFPSVELPADTSYPVPGILVDDRALAQDDSESVSRDCSLIDSIALQGQRTTVGMGVQFRVGLVGSGGLPLDAAAHASCIGVERADGLELTEAHAGAPVTNALTVLLVQPPSDETTAEQLRQALLRLFMSRPRGERVALYRWGASVQQVVALTNYRDTFSDGLDRLGLLEDEPVDAGVAVTSVQQVLESVADDAHAWARNVVVVAPNVLASELTHYERDVNVLWAIDTEGTSGFRYVPTSETDPSIGMAQVSARLNAIRRAGFVTFGVCGDGLETPVSVLAATSGVTREVVLKNALVEEQGTNCDPGAVLDFDYYDSRLVELSFDAEQRELYDDAVRERDDTVSFGLTTRLSPDHGATVSTASLRGGTSLQQCMSNRMNFSIDFDGGRERFFYPESSGSVGSDEFYLTAMCLDPMYVNQLTMDRLMASVGMFVSGTRLVELRVDGETQGVYLLMEQVKEALVRSQSDLLSVIRRRRDNDEVKFPGDDDVSGQELALQQFETLMATAETGTGADRLLGLAPHLDLHRYMFFVAVQSAIENADWGDEPSFFATATSGPDGKLPFFAVNGWDPDDVLLDRCAHDGVLSDEFEMIGCAEHPLEKAIFAADRDGSQVVDDELYAMYVDALEVVLAHLTEAEVSSFYDQTVAELETFIDDPDIVAVMPDWANEEDPRASMLDLVAARKARYAEHRDYLLGQVEVYRAAHAE